ncbi:uncharacterized protein PAC_05260 [Phialocephala subalpina]|uniref:AttH domain-containing protein n=1 Tax=Phialocephala subalpina TaxID=576137 RepID=A0A1L7WRH2_9HELO|nr:uncharacterized protein PAC_05260 [Phialocephala subalpina]
MLLVDITGPFFYVQVNKAVNAIIRDLSVLNVTYDHYGFESLTTDQYSTQRTWSTVPELTFDISFNATSPVLLNAELGTFQFGAEPTFEWAMPAAKTSGSFEVGGKTLFIDPTRSLTWYGRQWGGYIRNWTWFELHLGENADAMRVSFWVFSDETYPGSKFAMMRLADGTQNVLPVTSFLAKTNRTYTAPDTGVTYPLDWEINLADGSCITASSIRPNQVIIGPTVSQHAYEGEFLLCKGPEGNMLGNLRGRRLRRMRVDMDVDVDKYVEEEVLFEMEESQDKLDIEEGPQDGEDEAEEFQDAVEEYESGG